MYGGGSGYWLLLFCVFFLFLTGNKNRNAQFVKRNNKIRNKENIITSF